MSEGSGLGAVGGNGGHNSGGPAGRGPRRVRPALPLASGGACRGGDGLGGGRAPAPRGGWSRGGGGSGGRGGGTPLWRAWDGSGCGNEGCNSSNTGGDLHCDCFVKLIRLRRELIGSWIEKKFENEGNGVEEHEYKRVTVVSLIVVDGKITE